MKGVSAEQLGKKPSGGLKICFWETGVPVRVRPRPPQIASKPADCRR
jgi:hypothetical protein